MNKYIICFCLTFLTSICYSQNTNVCTLKTDSLKWSRYEVATFYFPCDWRIKIPKNTQYVKRHYDSIGADLSIYSLDFGIIDYSSELTNDQLKEGSDLTNIKLLRSQRGENVVECKHMIVNKHDFIKITYDKVFTTKNDHKLFVRQTQYSISTHRTLIQYSFSVSGNIKNEKELKSKFQDIQKRLESLLTETTIQQI